MTRKRVHHMIRTKERKKEREDSDEKRYNTEKVHEQKTQCKNNAMYYDTAVSCFGGRATKTKTRLGKIYTCRLLSPGKHANCATSVTYGTYLSRERGIRGRD